MVRPLAYLSELRAFILEGAPGTPLDEIIHRDGDTTGAVRRAAQALAAFNQGDAPATTRQYLLADEVVVLEKARRVLVRACPHLRVEVESIIEGILAGLQEVPLRPTHRDLSPDHIFVDGERTIFIDLDSLAKADPVLDPAHILVRLAKPAQFPIPRQRPRTAAREFAEEYFAHVPSTWQERLPSTTPAHSSRRPKVSFVARYQTGRTGSQLCWRKPELPWRVGFGKVLSNHHGGGYAPWNKERKRREGWRNKRRTIMAVIHTSSS